MLWHQVPGAVCLTCEEWGPESGLVTAAMKLKRRPLQVDLHLIHHPGCLRTYWYHISWPCLCHISKSSFWWEMFRRDIRRTSTGCMDTDPRSEQERLTMRSFGILDQPYVEDLVSRPHTSWTEVTSAEAIKGRVCSWLKLQLIKSWQNQLKSSRFLSLHKNQVKQLKERVGKKEIFCSSIFHRERHLKLACK